MCLVSVNWHTFSHRTHLKIHEHTYTHTEKIKKTKRKVYGVISYFFLHLHCIITIKTSCTREQIEWTKMYNMGATVSFKMKYCWKIVGFRIRSGSFFVKCYLSLSIIVSNMSVCSGNSLFYIFFLTHVLYVCEPAKNVLQQQMKFLFLTNFCVFLLLYFACYMLSHCDEEQKKKITRVSLSHVNNKRKKNIIYFIFGHWNRTRTINILLETHSLNTKIN